MAYGNFLKDAFGKAKSRLEGFLYHEDAAIAAPPPSMNDEGAAPAAEPYAAQQPGAAPYAYQQPYQAQQPYQSAYQQAVYQQPVYQQPYGAQQPAYQQPAQGAEQPSAYQRPAYQAPSQPQSGPFSRNRRAERALAHQESNVVDFAAYQQQGQQEAAPAAPQSAANGAANARIINARGMADCRSAITLLRNGDTVLIVLENISEPAEMRRLVDTLSGACYSLTATITKVSRYGVYLLAPQSMAVYADQATNQMNMVPSRAPQRPAYQQPVYNGQQQAQRPAYQQPAYTASPAYQQPVSQQGAFVPPQSSFTQRAAAPEEAPAQSFYARQPVQGAQIPAFSSQPAGYGYAPDEAAVEQ